ncbi:CASP-like protein 4D1 [Bidens hawaiensis]|uniref:CASP-like protein 4D1 n=1 Tax=Bidens hawaiensis TaxID=980011 RepID=UPI00404A0BBB
MGQPESPDQQPRSQPDEPLKIQVSDTPQADDHSQVQILNDSKPHYPHAPVRNVQVFAIVLLGVRVVTWLCLLASLIILASNTTPTIYTELFTYKFGFNDFHAYQYMMSAIVIGFAYTCVQVTFEVYQLATGKSLITGNMLPKIIFYGDKILLCFLATGVGAAFGATVDLKKKLDWIDDLLLLINDGYSFLTPFRPKLDNFFNMVYVSASFLVIAFLSSVASSILSSLALQKNGSFTTFVCLASHVKE